MAFRSVHCPYNSAHVMPESKLASHLLKCTFKTSDFATCQYNSSHILKRAQLQDHERQCPDRQDDEDWAFMENIKKTMKEESRQLKKNSQKREAEKKQQTDSRKQCRGFIEPPVLPSFSAQFSDKPLNTGQILDKSVSRNEESALQVLQDSSDQDRRSQPKKQCLKNEEVSCSNKKKKVTNTSRIRNLKIQDYDHEEERRETKQNKKKIETKPTGSVQDSSGSRVLCSEDF